MWLPVLLLVFDARQYTASNRVELGIFLPDILILTLNQSCSRRHALVLLHRSGQQLHVVEDGALDLKGLGSCNVTRLPSHICLCVFWLASVLRQRGVSREDLSTDPQSLGQIDVRLR